LAARISRGQKMVMNVDLNMAVDMFSILGTGADALPAD
jgi:hypothetical protein